MKIILRPLTLIMFFIIFSIHNFFSQQVKLKMNEKIVYNLAIEFNKEAVDANAILNFRTDYDKSALKISFSQGILRGNEYRIMAKKYQKLDKIGNEGITLTITPEKKAKAGNYTFSLKLTDTEPSGLFTGNEMDLKIDGIEIIPPPAVPFWKKYLWLLLCLTALCFIALFAINKKTRFDSGTIIITEPESFKGEYFLSGKKKIRLNDLNENITADFSLVWTKGGFPKIKTTETVFVNDLPSADGEILDDQFEVRVEYSENQKLILKYFK